MFCIPASPLGSPTSCHASLMVVPSMITSRTASHTSGDLANPGILLQKTEGGTCTSHASDGCGLVLQSVHSARLFTDAPTRARAMPSGQGNGVADAAVRASQLWPWVCADVRECS